MFRIYSFPFSCFNNLNLVSDNILLPENSFSGTNFISSSEVERNLGVISSEMLESSSANFSSNNLGLRKSQSTPVFPNFAGRGAGARLFWDSYVGSFKLITNSVRLPDLSRGSYEFPFNHDTNAVGTPNQEDSFIPGFSSRIVNKFSVPPITDITDSGRVSRG